MFFDWLEKFLNHWDGDLTPQKLLKTALAADVAF